MSGKPRCSETVKGQVRQGPDGMVRAVLPEPQCPLCKHHTPGLTVDTRGSLKTGCGVCPVRSADEFLVSLTRSGEQAAYSG
jgi:hypothetical protein